MLDTALHEPLPRGTGWFFTTGSIVTLLIGVQFITGVGLSMYYVPSPLLAYDSVRFIMTSLPMGWLFADCTSGAQVSSWSRPLFTWSAFSSSVPTKPLAR